MTKAIDASIVDAMTTIEAIEWAGGTQKKLADRLGMTQPSIAVWGEFPPIGRQYQIELLSKGKLKAERKSRPAEKQS